MAMADTMMGTLTDTLRDNANQADADALAMVAEPTQAGGVNPCREALITNFGLADPTAALQALKTTGGATQMGPFGIIEGPQNVFNGNTSTASFPVDGQPLSISQFLANNPSVSAATVGNNVFLDDSFNNRGRLGRAQDMIHEAVVHRANGRSDSEFAPANSKSPRTAGSNRINEIIKENCNRLPN